MSSSTPSNGPNQAASGMPSSSAFLFKAPFPISALKHRRVSLASPASPRIVNPSSFRDEMGLQPQASTQDASSSLAGAVDFSLPEKKGKMRKIDSTQGSDESSPQMAEKKPRKKWSTEETQMLVDGCNKHGVGNWKIILQDPDLHFLDRSAVDLKDRFRTYFPDAYKKHYPNAKTHLSTKVRATFPDGSSMFEKTRSKRRRPFTPEEDRALKAGYDKHGTTWATIVKDPVFQAQNRRSTDLRDRFRNAFPDLYQAAGYKPRSSVKKKDGPVRAADDQLSTTAGPVRSRRRAATSQGLLRGGTKSVPQSTACSEDEESSAGEEDNENPNIFRSPPTPVFVDNVSTMPFYPNKKSSTTASSIAPILSSSSHDAFSLDTDDEMQLITSDTDPLQIPDFHPNNAHTDMETWSGINTPTHSSTAAWSTAAASPTSSHPSDFFMTPSHASTPGHLSSNAPSPYLPRPNTFNMIGKSAWGTDDWFSPNPRLDARSGSSFGGSLADANSPFASFHGHLTHGVVERYDLFPPYVPDGYASDAGMGDTHTAFSDEFAGSGAGSAGAGGGTGFKGYHSQIAGDLISGAGARMHHQPPPSFGASLSASLSNMYASSFAHGFGADPNGEISGLGLEGMQQENAGIHPLQLHAHTPSLPAIEELGITAISLDDRADTAGPQEHGDAMVTTDAPNMLGMSFSSLAAARSPAKPQLQQHHQRSCQSHAELTDARDGLGGDLLSLGLEDLVDMNELHATPPATPIMTQPRPMRRSSGGGLLNSFDTPGIAMGMGGGHHARSISVPPSEARNGGAMLGGAHMSIDDVGLHMYGHTHGHGDMQQPDFSSMGRNPQAFFGMGSSPPESAPGNGSAQTQRPDLETMRLNNSSSSIHSPISPAHDQQQHSSQLTPLFPAHLILSPSSPAGVLSSPHAPHEQPHGLAHTEASGTTDLWRGAQSLGDYNAYNLSFLDLHVAYGSMLPAHAHNSLGLDVPGQLDDYADVRQGQALDLAQSAALAQSSMGITSLGLGLPFRAFDTPSPVGTIRHHAGREIKRPPIPEAFSAPAPVTNLSQQQQQHELAINGTLENINVRPTIRGGVRTSSGIGTGTIRQVHVKPNTGATSLGRSMSHHRGQSAVCPQDLVLRNDNKRKRASWDGGLG